MLIKDVSRSEGGNEYLIVDDTNTAYTVSAGDFRRLQLPFADDDSIYPLEVADDMREILSSCSAKLRCIKYLKWYIDGYGEKSIKRLIEKCKENGYSDTCAREAVELMCEFSMIDEKSACERRISVYANEKLYGKFRIKQELAAKGYSRESIAWALENCETDFYENAALMYAKLTKRSLPKDQKEKKKIADKMLRYGYSYDEIKYASSCEYDEI